MMSKEIYINDNRVKHHQMSILFSTNVTNDLDGKRRKNNKYNYCTIESIERAIAISITYLGCVFCTLILIHTAKSPLQNNCWKTTFLLGPGNCSGANLLNFGRVAG